jgi:hypothetical protein
VLEWDAENDPAIEKPDWAPCPWCGVPFDLIKADSINPARFDRAATAAWEARGRFPDEPISCPTCGGVVILVDKSSFGKAYIRRGGPADLT